VQIVNLISSLGKGGATNSSLVARLTDWSLVENLEQGALCVLDLRNSSVVEIPSNLESLTGLVEFVGGSSLTAVMDNAFSNMLLLQVVDMSRCVGLTTLILFANFTPSLVVLRLPRGAMDLADLAWGSGLRRLDLSSLSRIRELGCLGLSSLEHLRLPELLNLPVSLDGCISLSDVSLRAGSGPTFGVVRCRLHGPVSESFGGCGGMVFSELSAAGEALGIPSLP
jgi:hypothetical protein